MASPADFVEDLSDDVLSRVLLHLAARDALPFAAASRAMRVAADATARRVYAQAFGCAELAASFAPGLAQGRAKLFARLDRARSPNPQCVRETFAWAAGFGYCSFLSSTAKLASDAWPPAAREALLNGRPQGGPPLWRAAKRRQPKALALLLELRADAESSRGGTTALFWCARHGDVSAVELLLSAGASPLLVAKEANAGNGHTGPRYPAECALSAALQAPMERPSSERLRAMQLMAQSLSSAQREEGAACRALLTACDAGAASYVSVLVECHIGAVPQGAQGAQTEEETPVLVALSRGFSEVAELLLLKDPRAAGFVNAALASGKSALHLAAERGDKVLPLLLKARASLDAATSSGRTALHLAVEHDQEQALQVLCAHPGTKVRHLLQQTPNGASPICLAERRGKPSLILPMLRCYHRHLRERYLAGKLGDAGDRISDPSLTAMCLKYRDTLFLNDGEAAAKVVSQSAKVACLQLAPEKEEEDKLQRYQRVMERTRSGADGGVSGRGRLRSQLDLHLQRARSFSRDEPKGRKPWGAAVVRQRPPSASPASANRGQGTTTCPPSSQLPRVPRPKAQAAGALHGSPLQALQGLQGLQRSAGSRREVLAMAAEDEMQDLLRDFLSEGEEPEAALSAMAGSGHLEMYSSDEEP
ncbi:unnamed protein product [Effrenium voratum]|uniref:Uncharacterized protein n=1 Tax=Effrenium voratum TaxID=2562239 RepID=A0AA36MUE1_9DINO|nr:unnamed protein product [Effrenium voratum]